MANTYTQTPNFGLDLYGDDDPADLREGHNSNMVKIDAALRTLENASAGYQVITQAQASATASANSASAASRSESASASSAASASTSASQAASSATAAAASASAAQTAAGTAAGSASTAQTAAGTATKAVASMPVIMTATNQAGALALSAANPDAWVFYPEGA